MARANLSDHAGVPAIPRRLGRPDSTKLDDFWEASPDAAQHAT